jgi:hypothetical protein
VQITHGKTHKTLRTRAPLAIGARNFLQFCGSVVICVGVYAYKNSGQCRLKFVRQHSIVVGNDVRQRTHNIVGRRLLAQYVQ